MKTSRLKTSYLYRCELCKDEFPFESIRYSSDGKKVVCMDCFSKSLKEQKKKVDEKQIKEIPRSVKLICSDCSYRFYFRVGSKVKLICPYCGKSNIRKDDLTAEKLIEEISQSGYK